MSAAKTGTPAAEKPSANTCSVTVLPVPVAPVTRPCRFASAQFDALGRQIAAGLAAADEDQPVLHIVAGIGDGLLRPRSAVRSGHFHSSKSSIRTQGLTTDP